MAVCTDCDQEMRTADGCSADGLLIRDERFDRVTVDRRAARGGRCHDCGAARGGFHHLGCDAEDCPRCGWQLISCGCSWVDDDTSSLFAVAGDVVVSGALEGLHLAPARFLVEATAARR